MTTADNDTRRELVNVFGDAVRLHDEVMAECLSMLRLYGLGPSDLFYKYEAFLLSRPSGLRARLSTFTLDVARQLRTELQRESQAKVVAASAASTPNGNAKVAGVRKKAGGMSDLGQILGLTTPVRPKASGPTPASVSRNGNTPSHPSPSAFGTPSRTPTGANASAYRPAAGPSRLAAPAATPLNRSAVAPSSPISGSESPHMLMPPPPQPFGLRSNPHSLLETLNGHLTTADPLSSSGRPRVELGAIDNHAEWNYRYMFEKMSARSEALDEQIDRFGERIMENYELFDLGDPHLPSDDDIYTVGRILARPTDTSKLSANDLLLQSSRLLGSGKVISLRFASPGILKVRGGAPGVRGFGLYPGVLVGLKGRNGGGDVFVVEEVLHPSLPDFATSTRDEIVEYQHGDRYGGGKPISIYSAAGPFTLDTDLEYEPLEALVSVVCEERPDAVIFLGPFVDATHPHIQSGKILVTPVEIFREKVAARLSRIHELSPATRVILVPSVRDMISSHMAYPQAMLDPEGLGLSRKVQLLPNPCTFRINEMIISVGSMDVLFHLRKEEVFQRAEESDPDPGRPTSANPQGDAMANLVRHLLTQRSFYPLFPAPESVSQEVNLDITHWHKLGLAHSPDIMILPSKLKHFAKIVDGTVAINPGHLCRAHSAGTFAKTTIHPRPLHKPGTDEKHDDEHYVDERARCEIWRI